MQVIGVFDGYALGAGMVTSSLCDLRIASDEARFGLPEIAGGTVGGARHLLRVLPQGTVRHLALTGEHLSAERARELRSEEHTSELQSLMRISYAVFCLKKKKPERTYTMTITLPNHTTSTIHDSMM